MVLSVFTPSTPLFNKFDTKRDTDGCFHIKSFPLFNADIIYFNALAQCLRLDFHSQPFISVLRLNFHYHYHYMTVGR